MRKGISMGGAGWQVSPVYSNDYRWYQNDAYVRDSKTAWIKLWINMDDLLSGAQPTTATDMWNHLASPGPAAKLDRLTAQIQLANTNNVAVLLTMQQNYPAWMAANPAQSLPNSVLTHRPADLSSNGPYGWFVSFLLCRYSRKQGGPWIEAFEPLNEPNHTLWPKDNIGCACAVAIQTAAAYAGYWSSGQQGIRIVGPGLAQWGSALPDWNTSSTTAISDTYNYLSGWNPPSNVAFCTSVHTYNDVMSSNGENTVALFNWLASAYSRDSLIWVTESGALIDPGYNGMNATDKANAEAVQASRVEQNFHSVAVGGRGYVWVTHLVNAPQNVADFDSALRSYGAVPSSTSTAVGTPRALWYSWKSGTTLQGETTI